MRLNIDLQRIERNLNRAQFLLDSAVMDSMEPLMPTRVGGGGFIGVTRAMSAALAGSGQVVAAAPPYGRFLYEGEVMVDEKTGSPYARKNAKKVPVSRFSGKTNVKNTKLQYARASATDHWFDEAKERDLKAWEQIAAHETNKK